MIHEKICFIIVSFVRCDIRRGELGLGNLKSLELSATEMHFSSNCANEKDDFFFLAISIHTEAKKHYKMLQKHTKRIFCNPCGSHKNYGIEDSLPKCGINHTVKPML